jgi:hypothetical protein
MRVQVTTRNEDGSIAFDGTINKAEVTTLLQYAINNLMAMGFVMDLSDLAEDDDETIRIQSPSSKGKMN